MLGIPWEQHVAFLDDRRLARSIVQRVGRSVRSYAGHPALFSFAVGNEIPAAIVRWHGAARTERFIEQLYLAAKDQAPESLVTYVNYPSTEYLELPFLDIVSFNVYLEKKARLDAYLARLQNLADDRPLVIAEVGLDSRQHGLGEQADSLAWQVRSVFDAGCAGAFVFAWTDEWHRGGSDVIGWDFGLTDRERRPKPALSAITRMLRAGPFPANAQWPLVSVVVCTYNGQRTIGECLAGLSRLDYPNYEVIVVNDGSTDGTAEIIARHAAQFRVITTDNRGLSNARNLGLSAASGAITAYIDDDAYPDPHWLRYLVLSLSSSTHAGMGGPNLPPPGDGVVADCVANAPGGPTHVLLSDSHAEHIPGCNMAFRTEALREVGGFDPLFRVAGDDVDLCWRFHARGFTIGFSPAAVVWHHRRGSVRAYFRQQRGYGKAEALLARKWPDKYNELGHLRWSGRVYGKGVAQLLSLRSPRIYHGVWNSAPFQSVYRARPGTLGALVLMPEWYLIVAALAAVSVLGLVAAPLLWALPLLVLACSLSVVQAGLSAARARFPIGPAGPTSLRWGRRLMVALLHLGQPLARLAGRLEFGLTPWRRCGHCRTARLDSSLLIWTSHWRSMHERLCWFEQTLREFGTFVYRGGEFDPWDLEVRGGLLASARLQMAVEDHEDGKQLVRMRLSAQYTLALIAIAVLIATAVRAAQGQSWVCCGVFAGLGSLLLLRSVQEYAVVATAVRASVKALLDHEDALLLATNGSGATRDAEAAGARPSERRPLANPERGSVGVYHD